MKNGNELYYPKESAVPPIRYYILVAKSKSR
jgi:hypothetical protein